MEINLNENASRGQAIGELRELEEERVQAMDSVVEEGLS